MLRFPGDDPRTPSRQDSPVSVAGSTVRGEYM